MELIWSVLLSTGFVSFLLFLARNWLSEKIKKSIEHTYSLRLEETKGKLRMETDTQILQLKADFEKEAEKIKFASSFFGESQKILISKNVEAISILWQKTLSMREIVPSIIRIDNIPIDAYEKMYMDSTLNEVLFGELTPEKMKRILHDDNGVLERLRLYIDEYLWLLFDTYQQLIIFIYVTFAIKKDLKAKLYWYQDEHIREILNSSLSAEDIEEFDKKTHNRFNWLQKKYESKILKTMRKIMTGQEIGEEALRQISMMEKAVSKNRTEIEQQTK